MDTIVEIALTFFSLSAAIVGVLTLTSKENHKNCWKNTGLLAKSLAVIAFIVFGVGLAKVYFDNLQDSENEKKIERWTPLIGQ